ncbi:tripartite tricarboxylate transporter substrate binding protein [Siccirubricoccus sp. G192]|uniref:Bug family tripartite tricarboxylate transporter substrate binding protein n=1 Tax=Siccirubricoccus sp. G192 TaxID=2849651 RepID=UPI001C2BFD0B|nr:tripartite tricarboxylate transporter substrate binding protein [Siccirubricoccus sp. G192]MBV1799708.1 tripartite tricarboxylate transporter substrate binding protein [Siccirubricoccus sp. G192]
MRPNDGGWTRRGALGAAAGLLAAPRLARAAFPDRPVRLIVPYGGGGQTDIVSRLTAEAMAQRLGQPVLVDNRPGGAGNLAAELLARSPADGYTMSVATMGTNSGLNALLYRSVGYDWERDFAPIGMFCSTACVLLVHTSIPGRDLPELLDWIRANPGRFTFASAGVGAITHLAMELLGSRLGLEMVHVPYRQSTQAMTDLLSGRVHSRCLGLPEGDTVRSVASIRPMAVTTTQRSPLWPGVPAMAETVPDYEASSYFGLSVPARTPPEVVARLNGALQAALQDERVRAAYARVGADPAEPHAPEWFGARARADAAKWSPLIRALKLTAE